jgi:serine/threonine protein kinase/tetratricopeptide (TPR) repeat protein
MARGKSTQPGLLGRRRLLRGQPGHAGALGAIRGLARLGLRWTRAWPILDAGQVPFPAVTDWSSGGETTTIVGDATGQQSAGQSSPALDVRRGTSVGRYVIVDRIGAGGMGVVFSAYDPELDRKVALKLLNPANEGTTSGSQGERRLLREARAMARLSHPNVVAVHDVGTFEDRVFMAMEFIEGGTLSDWMGKPHEWREVLSVFLRAGRGLAAAHAADLVHRDFKPDNVMMGPGDRVRVMDFGLARGGDEAEEIETLATGENSTSSLDDIVLTKTGAIMGTPAYMAPEQHAGNRAGPAADQFAFCVALYTALFGKRPFGGDGLAALAFQVIQGNVQPIPRDTRVPRRAQRAILRGLSRRERERWPHVDDLLVELVPARQRRWTGGVAVTVGAAGLVGVGAGLFSVGAPDTCAGGRERIEEVWSEDQRAAVQQAFANTQVPYATDSWRAVEPVLAAYSDGWVASYVDACETAERGERSDRMLDLQMACLESRRQDLHALVDVFEQADRDVVTNSVTAVRQLPSLRHCADLEALDASVDPPPSELASAVDDLRVQLAQARALDSAGMYGPGRDLARTIVADAEALGYAPLHAEALLLLGNLEDQEGDSETAANVLKEAAWTAHAARHDEIEAKAASALIDVVGNLLAKRDQGLEWSRHAEASVTRLGSPPLLVANQKNSLAALWQTHGDFNAAREGYEEALSIFEAEYGSDHPVVAQVMSNLAVALRDLGESERAREMYQRSLEIRKATLGAKHPQVAESLNNLANLDARRGDNDSARALHLQALAIREASLPAAHPSVGNTLRGLGIAERQSGNNDAALGYYRRAIAIYEEAYGPKHPSVAATFNSIAIILVNEERFEEARTEYQRTLEILQEAFGAEHPHIAIVTGNIGKTYLEEERFAEALPLHERALEIREKVVGPDAPAVAVHLTGIGKSLVGLRRAGEAVAPLERALGLRQGKEVLPADFAETSFHLADALWASGGDKKRARELASDGLAAFESSGGDYGDDVATIRTWFSERGIEPVPVESAAR